MHTIELTCDDTLDSAVRAAWDRLAAEGLPSQARHPHPSNRPHLTLAVCERLPPGAPAAFAEAFGDLPVPVRLGPLLLFAGRARVLAWGVVPEARLVAVHAKVWRVLGGSCGGNPLHAPGRWLPHVTLARNLDAATRARAVTVLEGLAEATGAFSGARSHDGALRTTVPLAGRG
ncbi:2'-5' RNA ligase family protein [Streptosporangium sp. NPDC023615]|uniref:2'-5' RNA ligase family protein n=1 Tax=Streptosporangium sp. NPDC023615 TaxID=3154794 RepID=UPI00343677D9